LKWNKRTILFYTEKREKRIIVITFERKKEKDGKKMCYSGDGGC
jgi:hypothetical protein